ncbi:hypothetical protein BYT27DRAFT_7117675 [Phlegmacium glaucopus]|nr:hypothetical protein BYT27DRAFT_7117675 [Phlegmacium glaucopus]
MPVQLPLQPAGVNLPPQPHDPPTLADVVAAKSYQARVDVAAASQAPNAPTTQDAAMADVYKTGIIMAHSAAAAAPAWFHPAMTTILAPIRITLAQTRNHQLHDGSFTPFTIVPFNDGTMPTQNPHNLPPLVNAAAIRQLTAGESTLYAVGYELGNIGPAPARRVAIGRVVGCTVAI